METNKKKKKKKNFFSDWEFFVWNWEKNILFGIGNGTEFRPQNRVIESPEYISQQFLLRYAYLADMAVPYFCYDGVFH